MKTFALVQCPGVRFMLYLLVTYLAWLAALNLFWQDRIIFPRHIIPPSAGIPFYEPTHIIRLDIERGGQVEGWFMPVASATTETPAPAVIFFHGNGEIIDYLDDIVAGYHRLGYSVLLPEYRGYGRSDGKPSQRAICSDARRFYDALTQRPDVDASRIVFHGRSLGGGVAAQLALERKPAALILQSVFKSVASMAWRVGAPPFLVRHPFYTDRAVAQLNVPILIFHGTRDEIIPVSHGRRLRRLAPHAVYIEYDAGHNDFPGRGREERYWTDIREFLDRPLRR